MARWIKLHTQILEHPLFEKNPVHFFAWVMLLQMAAFKARRVSVNGKIIDLERGQLCASVRYLSERCGMSKSAFQRFLTRLKTDTMIGTASGTGILIITICNYSIYQGENSEGGTASGTASGTAAGQQRDKYKELEGIEGLEEDSMAEPAFDFPQSDHAAAKPSTEKKYAFAGKVIRLTDEDFDNWLGIYHAIPDLRAELHSLDDWYADQPPAEVKNWFQRVKSRLNKKHQAAFLAKSEKSTKDPFSQFGAVDLKSVLQQQQERDRLDEQNRIASMAEGD